MLTALELAREGWKPYLEAAGRRSSPPEPTSVERSERARLLARIREAAEALKAHFAVRRLKALAQASQEEG